MRKWLLLLPALSGSLLVRAQESLPTSPAVGAAPAPRLTLDVAQFTNLDQVQGGAEVEVYATVATQALTYRQRAPKQFQAAATVTLEILKADGQPAFQETVTLKPPTLTDTTIQIKNPVSFLKRVGLPAGRYTLRAQVRDEYDEAGGATSVEQPLEVAAAPKTPSLSSIVLLARPAGRGGAAGADAFSRGGYRLTRAPGGRYARGAGSVFFYTELSQALAGAELSLHYHLAAPDGSAADADAPLTAQAGRSTVIAGQLPLGPLPEGAFSLTIEVRNAAGELLTTQTVAGRRETQDYAPAPR